MGDRRDGRWVSFSGLLGVPLTPGRADLTVSVMVSAASVKELGRTIVVRGEIVGGRGWEREVRELGGDALEVGVRGRD